MALDVDGLKSRAQTTLRKFSAPQLVIIGLLGAVGILAGVMFLRWVSTPTYDVLLAGLDSKDAAAITDKLKSEGVPYKLAGGGATILVPASQVDSERLAVAAAGLPKGTTSGYELLDKQGMTSSSFQQQVAYQRAIEGELSRSLSSIHGVRTATVHLAIPDQRLFSDQQQPAHASVLLDTDSELGD